MSEQKHTVVKTKNLKKAFGENVILNGFNFELKSGESVSLLGKSGSGKSVFIKILIGLLQADGGKIEVLETDMTSIDEKELQEMRKKIGFLFQNGALYDSMTLYDNMRFPLDKTTIDFSEEEINEKIEEALESVGLDKAKEKRPGELSGGMQKRASLARVLVMNPEIILYDEPTTGLDPETSLEISQLIKDTAKRNKNASIIITHDMQCAELISDRIVMLRDGKNFRDNTFDELIKDNDTWVQSFFSSLKNKQT